jgi:hypothetical protein
MRAFAPNARRTDGCSIACAGIFRIRTKFGGMARDLASFLRRTARSAKADPARCSSCNRVPLPGELMHELESHSVVCQLCLADLPEPHRVTISCERVRAADRPLTVARAA